MEVEARIPATVGCAAKPDRKRPAAMESRYLALRADRNNRRREEEKSELK